MKGSSFSPLNKIESIEFQGEELELEDPFFLCFKLKYVSFPNAKKLNLKGNSYPDKILVRSDLAIVGNDYTSPEIEQFVESDEQKEESDHDHAYENETKYSANDQVSSSTYNDLVE